MGTQRKINMLRATALLCMVALAGASSCVWTASDSTCAPESTCGCSTSEAEECGSTASTGTCSNGCVSYVAINLVCAFSQIAGASESECTSAAVASLECSSSSVGVMIVAVVGLINALFM